VIKILRNGTSFRRWMNILLVLLLFYNLYHIGVYIRDSHRSSELQKNISQSYEQVRDDPGISQSSERVRDESDPETDEGYLEEFQPLIKLNSDIVGWIRVPNTRIDYPVVQTKDNEYYLSHSIEKKPSKSGSIFMDYRNNGNGGDRNIILYGHHMKDGSMFKDLMKYKDSEFYREASRIQFSTLYEKAEWEIFSVYITSPDFDYIQTHFFDDEDFETFLEEIQGRSHYPTKVEVGKEDTILTLSTCTYEFQNARLVVHAKKL
jgi:sortase B